MPNPIPSRKTRPVLRGVAPLTLCVAMLALAGCMSLSVRPTTYTPVPAATAVQPLRLAKAVAAPLTNDATVMLAEGSQWSPAGSIPQGLVYRKLGGTLMIDAKRLREAYPVVADNKLVGFYFPGESAFTPVTYATTMDLEPTP